HRGQPKAAFEALELRLAQPYPPDRFAGAREVLREELGIGAGVWLHAQATSPATIQARLAALGVPMATSPSLRMVLTWESDLSDVDLYVSDSQSNTASSELPVLPSGGRFVSDVNTGFGPECFVVPNPASGY